MLLSKLTEKYKGKMLAWVIDDIQKDLGSKQLSIIHSARDNIDRETDRINCVIDEESIIKRFMYG